MTILFVKVKDKAKTKNKVKKKKKKVIPSLYFKPLRGQTAP